MATQGFLLNITTMICSLLNFHSQVEFKNYIDVYYWGYKTTFCWFFSHLFGKRFVRSPPVPVYYPSTSIGFSVVFCDNWRCAPRFIDGATAGVTPGSCIWTARTCAVARFMRHTRAMKPMKNMSWWFKRKLIQTLHGMKNILSSIVIIYSKYMTINCWFIQQFLPC